MPETVALRSIQTSDEKEKERIVGLLRKLLADAEAGRIDEVYAVVSFDKNDPEGNSFDVHYAGGSGIVRSLGFLEMVKGSLIARARED